jgi:hypothetical protein
VILLGTKAACGSLFFKWTVREHVEKLQAQRDELNSALMSGHRTLAERNAIESEIRAVTMALEHFSCRASSRAESLKEKINSSQKWKSAQAWKSGGEFTLPSDAAGRKPL